MQRGQSSSGLVRLSCHGSGVAVSEALHRNLKIQKLFHMCYTSRISHVNDWRCEPLQHRFRVVQCRMRLGVCQQCSACSACACSCHPRANRHSSRDMDSINLQQHDTNFMITGHGLLRPWLAKLRHFIGVWESSSMMNAAQHPTRLVFGTEALLRKML